MINLNFKKQGFWPNLLDDKDNMCFPSICFTHSLLKRHLFIYFFFSLSPPRARPGPSRCLSSSQAGPRPRRARAPYGPAPAGLGRAPAPARVRVRGGLDAAPSAARSPGRGASQSHTHMHARTLLCRRPGPLAAVQSGGVSYTFLLSHPSAPLQTRPSPACQAK